MCLARSCLSKEARQAAEDRKKQKQFEKIAARRQSRVNFDNTALDHQRVEDIQDILQCLEEKDKDSSRVFPPALPRFSWVSPAANGLPPSPRQAEGGRMTLLTPTSPSGGGGDHMMFQR